MKDDYNVYNLEVNFVHHAAICDSEKQKPQTNGPYVEGKNLVHQ
jgi:hypothetical protein